MDIYCFTYAARLIRDNAMGLRVFAVRGLRGGFALEMAARGGVSFIAVSVNPDAPALVWLDASGHDLLETAEIDEDNGFTRALTHHLEGTELVSADFPAGERCGELLFSKKTEFGKETSRILVIEIMGRHSGAFILNERRIVASAARKYDLAKNTYRRIVTGRKYPDPPPLSKPAIFGIDFEDFKGLLEAYGQKSPETPAFRGFQACFSGLTGDLIWAIFAATGVNDGATAAEIAADSATLRQIYDNFDAMTRGERTAIAFGGAENPATVNKLAFAAAFVQAQGGLIAEAADSDKKRAPVGERRKRILALELERVKNYPAISAMSEWLVATASEEGALGAPITAELRNKAMDFAEKMGCLESVRQLLQKDEPPEILAGLLVKTAERHKSAVNKLGGLLESAEEAMQASTQGKDSAAVALSKKRTTELASLRKLGIKHKVLTSSDGVPIVVGLSDKANDALLKRYGSTPHWWFHTRDVPGSWVIALTGRAAMPDRTRVECAIVAAAHSKDKGEHLVEVSYAQMKNLRKPKNAPPGRVLVKGEKSITVSPSEFAALKDRLQWQ